MTRVEREKRIESLKNRLFLLNMVDRWTNEDRDNIRKIEEELRELEEVAQIERKDKDNKRVVRLFFIDRFLSEYSDNSSVSLQLFRKLVFQEQLNKIGLETLKFQCFSSSFIQFNYS